MAASGTTPVNLQQLDIVVHGYLQEQAESQSRSKLLSLCRAAREAALHGDIQEAITKSDVVCESALQDPRLLFRLKRQQLFELLRRESSQSYKAALAFVRTELAPLAMQAYPEAYGEFKHSMMAFVYGEQQSGTPMSHAWSMTSRSQLADLLYSTLRISAGLHDTVLEQQLKYLLCIYDAARNAATRREPPPSWSPSSSSRMAAAVRDGSAAVLCAATSADGDDVVTLARALLPCTDRCPQPLPVENVPLTTNEAVVQDLMGCLGLERGEASEALKRVRGDAHAALLNELCRFSIHTALLDALVNEYAAYRGLRPATPGDITALSQHIHSMVAATKSQQQAEDVELARRQREMSSTVSMLRCDGPMMAWRNIRPQDATSEQLWQFLQELAPRRAFEQMREAMALDDSTLRCVLQLCQDTAWYGYLRRLKGVTWHALVKLEGSQLRQLLRFVCRKSCPAYLGRIDPASLDSAAVFIQGLVNVWIEHTSLESLIDYCSPKQDMHGFDDMVDDDVDMFKASDDEGDHGAGSGGTKHSAAHRSAHPAEVQSTPMCTSQHTAADAVPCSSAVAAGSCHTSSSIEAAWQLPLLLRIRESEAATSMLDALTLLSDCVNEINARDAAFFERRAALLFDIKRTEAEYAALRGDSSAVLHIMRSMLRPLAEQHSMLQPKLRDCYALLLQPLALSCTDPVPSTSTDQSVPHRSAGGETPCCSQSGNIDHLYATRAKQLQVSCCAVLQSVAIALQESMGMVEPWLVRMLRMLLKVRADWYQIQRVKDRFADGLGLTKLQQSRSDASTIEDIPTTSDAGQGERGTDTASKSSGGVIPDFVVHSLTEIEPDAARHVEADDDHEDDEDDGDDDMAMDDENVLQLAEIMNISRPVAFDLLRAYGGDVQRAIESVLAG